MRHTVLIKKHVPHTLTDKPAGQPLPDTVFHTVSLLGAPVMRSILLLFLYSGFSNGFWSGVLTEQLNADMIGLAMVVVGVAEVLGGLFYGKLIVGCLVDSLSSVCPWLN